MKKSIQKGSVVTEMSIEEYRALKEKKAKDPKYKAIKCQYNGINFDSKKERDYYINLYYQQKAGLITKIVLQPRYDIFINSIFIGFYKADFEVTYAVTGNVEVIDAKGIATPVFNLKKKIIEALYGIKIKLV